MTSRHDSGFLNASNGDETDDAIARILDECLRRIEAGEAVSLDAMLTDYPEHAIELKPAFTKLRKLQALAARAGPGDMFGRLAREETLGDFRILREIGRGGMGVVYEAEQSSLKRRVALKVTNLSQLASSRQLTRFQIEAQVAAQLSHPHIVETYAVGCDDQVHYYAMRLIRGETLADVIRRLRCDESLALPADAWSGSRNWSVPTSSTDNRQVLSSDDGLRTARETRDLCAAVEKTNTSADTLLLVRRQQPRRYWQRCAELLIQAAEALDYAHRMGIVHRDIKPSNLMLDESGQLWVTDFGLARVSTDSSLTGSGDLVGTLRYMSPEQASGSKLLDGRADVYSLGATLYELLLLEPAFAASDAEPLLHAVLHEEPIRPRQRNPQLPRALETIVLVAMAKDPAERYPTAALMANDLSLWLAGRPIQAKRASPLQCVVRWIARNPSSSLLITLVFLLTVLLGAGFRIAQVQMQAAATALAAEKYFTLRSQSLRLSVDRPVDWPKTALVRLSQAAQQPAANHDREALRSEAIGILCAHDLIHTHTLRHQDTVHCLAFCHSGNKMAVGYNLMADRVPVELWNPLDGSLINTLTFPADPNYLTSRGARGDGVRSLAFSPNHRYLAAGSRSGWIHLWDLTDKSSPCISWRAHEKVVSRVAFSRDSAALLSSSEDGKLRMWTVAGQGLLNERQHTLPIVDFAFRGPGTVLCALSDRAVLLDVKTFEELPFAYAGDAMALVVSPTSLYCGVAAASGRLVVVDGDGTTARLLRDGPDDHAHSGRITHVAASYDGGLIASSCNNQSLKIWDPLTGGLVRQLELGTTGNIYAEFSRRGALAVTVDRVTRVYQIHGSKVNFPMAAGVTTIDYVDAHHKYRLLTTIGPQSLASEALSVRAWNLGRSQREPLPRRSVRSTARDNVVCCLDINRCAVSGNRDEGILCPRPKQSSIRLDGTDVHALAFDPASEQLWAACSWRAQKNARLIGGIRAWDRNTGAEIAAWSNSAAESNHLVTDVHCLALSAKYVVGGAHDGTFVILRRQPFTLLHQAASGSSRVRSIALTTDEQLVLAGTDEGQLLLIRPEEGNVIERLEAHEATIESIAVHPRGPWIISGSAEGSLRIWRREALRLMPYGSLPKQRGAIIRCEFSAQGALLYTLARGDTAVQAWNLSELQAELQQMGIGD